VAAVRRKLLINADYYPTPDSRVYFMSGLYEGKAGLHIGPRLTIDASNPYRDVEDLIDHLKTVFDNPNRATEAYVEYQALVMKPKDDFNDFLAEFVRLAEESRQPQDFRQRTLYDKLPNMLQSQMMQVVDDPDVDFDKFVHLCQRTAHNITLQQKNRDTRRAATSTPSGQTPTKTTLTAKTMKNESPTTRSKLMNADKRAALMKEGRCFTCEEKGHVTRDCPRKTSAIALVDQNGKHTVTNAEDSGSDADQGKVDA
jgi:hypothetical protein